MADTETATGTGPAPEEAPASEEPPRKAEFYAAAVYGSIVAAALLGALREEHESPETTLLSLLVTLAVFWLVHVWSAIVGERIELGIGFTIRHAGEIARSEWPLIESAFTPAALLLLGWIGVLGGSTASTLALAACCLQLLGWGFVVGRRAYDHWWSAALSGLLNGVLGIALVLLEIRLLH